MRRSCEAELSSQEPPERAANWVPQLTVRQVATHSGGFGKVGGTEPMLFEPGTGWYYSDAGPNWLADFLTVSYMRDLRTVMRNRILTPLGIAADRVVWRSNRYRSATLRGIARREFGSGITTDVDVMARIGLMLLRDGRWNGKWLLQTSYPDLAGATDPTIARSFPGWSPNPDGCGKPNGDYGLLFWNNATGHRPTVPRTAYWSAGLGTSFIMVIPSLDIVAARAGPTWPPPADPCASTTAPFAALLVAAVVSGYVIEAPRSAGRMGRPTPASPRGTARRSRSVPAAACGAAARRRGSRAPRRRWPRTPC